LEKPRTKSDYFISSDRVGFSCWQADDLPAAMTLWGDPRVTKLFHKYPLDRDQVAARLAQEIANREMHHIQYWPIYSLADDAFIGCAGLRPHSTNVLELGVHLKPEYWGCGYATEVVQRVIDYAFEQNLAQGLIAAHHPQNIGSRQTLLKLGFIGTEKKLYEPTGLLHPYYLLFKQAPDATMRPATENDSMSLAIVHHFAIKETFSGLVDQYVTERSLEYCEKAWEKRLASNECTTRVLDAAGQVVGFAAVTESPDEELKDIASEVDRIYLHPSVWGKGYGKDLMRWCEEEIKSRGYNIAALWVFAVNARARAFYEKLGYGPDGCKKTVFETEILRYRKEI